MCLAAETTEPLSKRIETLNSILVVLHRNDTDRVSVRLVARRRGCTTKSANV